MPADFPPDARPKRIERVLSCLRFIERDVGNQRIARILQQQHMITDHNGERFEWRDVPVVTEEGTEGQFMEEIALSEAATKAWHKPEPKEPHIGEERAARERTARFDASLANQLQRSMERNAELTGLLQASIAANEALLERRNSQEVRLMEQADRILDLEAEIAISRRCNAKVDCLCRGEVMALNTAKSKE